MGKYYKHYHGSQASLWGDAYGLNSKDFTYEQLCLMHFSKIIEFANTDPRVEKIISNKINSIPLESLSHINLLKDEELSNLHIFKEAYNNMITLRFEEINNLSRNYNCNRDKIIFWRLLNNENKINEYYRWKNGKDSIINEKEIDYNWIEENDLEFFKSLVKDNIEKLKLSQYSRYNTNNGIRNMIRQISGEYLIKNIPIIKESSEPYNLTLLENKNLPIEDQVELFRKISGRKNICRLNVITSIKALSKVPTIMRLNLLETLIIYNYGSINIVDAEGSKDLYNILFGSLLRYNERVERLIKRYKLIIGEE